MRIKNMKHFRSHPDLYDSFYVYRKDDGSLTVRHTGNPGGFDVEGATYLGCYVPFFLPTGQHRTNWGYKLVPKDILGSVLDRLRKKLG